MLLQRVLQWASPRNLPWISPGIELLSKKESSTTKDSNFLQMQLSLDSPLANEVPLLRKRAVQSVDGKIEVVTPEETGIIDTIKSKLNPLANIIEKIKAKASEKVSSINAQTGDSGNSISEEHLVVDRRVFEGKQ